MKSVGVYVSVSTKTGTRKLTNSSSSFANIAARQGWNITQEYVDHESAKTGDSRRVQALLADASRRPG
jgi:DNA invertase Pin-like site-specific DNA recombinase